MAYLEEIRQAYKDVLGGLGYTADEMEEDDQVQLIKEAERRVKAESWHAVLRCLPSRLSLDVPHSIFNFKGFRFSPYFDILCMYHMHVHGIYLCKIFIYIFL